MLLSAKRDVNTSASINILLTLFLTLGGYYESSMYSIVLLAVGKADRVRVRCFTAETRDASIALVAGSKNDGYVLRNLRK